MGGSSEQSVLFAGQFGKPVHAKFDEPSTSSDGGALLLGALDSSLGLVSGLASCFPDVRQSGKVHHPLEELCRQRINAIACGSVDCNDATRLREDPVQKLLAGRDPVKGDALASPPTLSRFENSASKVTAFRLARQLADSVFLRHKRRLRKKKVKEITIDLDGSCDPTHGRQQLGLFNRYYDSWCFFPLFGFVSFNDEPEQYAFAGILRSGHAKEVEASLGLLKRAVPRLRKLFPKAAIRVRLDAGFQGPELFQLLDDLGVESIVGFASNSVLKALSEGLSLRAAKRSAITGKSAQYFGSARYCAGTWNGVERRIVFKAECLRSPMHHAKDNRRFVVTNSKLGRRQAMEFYHGRGDCENRIKEAKQLEVDRTSCHKAIANQIRILFTLAAYSLYQELRLRLRRTELGRAQVSTLRDRLIKIGARVERSVRRIVVHFTSHCPSIDLWHRAATACGATVS